jgi:hypothetical protein
MRMALGYKIRGGPDYIVIGESVMRIALSSNKETHESIVQKCNSCALVTP